MECCNEKIQLIDVCLISETNLTAHVYVKIREYVQAASVCIINGKYNITISAI